MQSIRWAVVAVGLLVVACAPDAPTNPVSDPQFGRTPSFSIDEYWISSCDAVDSRGWTLPGCVSGKWFVHLVGKGSVTVARAHAAWDYIDNDYMDNGASLHFEPFAGALPMDTEQLKSTGQWHADLVWGGEAYVQQGLKLFPDLVANDVAPENGGMLQRAADDFVFNFSFYDGGNSTYWPGAPRGVIIGSGSKGYTHSGPELATQVQSFARYQGDASQNLAGVSAFSLGDPTCRVENRGTRRAPRLVRVVSAQLAGTTHAPGEFNTWIELHLEITDAQGKRLTPRSSANRDELGNFNQLITSDLDLTDVPAQVRVTGVLDYVWDLANEWVYDPTLNAPDLETTWEFAPGAEGQHAVVRSASIDVTCN